MSESSHRSRPLHETLHPLYVIHSRWSIEEIYDLLSSFTSHPETDIGRFKIDYDQDGRDTNRTFVLLKDNLVKRLTDKGYDKSSSQGNKTGFSFSKYRIKDDLLLDNKSLCIPIPKDLRTTGKEIKEIIQEKLKDLLDFQVVKQSDFSVNVTLFDRFKDLPGSNAFIVFEPEIDDETICVVKAMIHNTYWKEGLEFILNCHYTRPLKKSSSGKKPFFKHEA